MLQTRDRLLECFPFEKMRKEQEQVIDALSPWLERIFEDPESKFYGIDAPTGTGKSALCVMVAKAIRDIYLDYLDSGGAASPEGTSTQVWIVTQNKLLQDQYNRDFENDVFDLRGLDNYRCYHDATTCGQSKCARLRAPENKKKWKPPEYCSRACEYDEVTEAAMDAPILLLNSAKALAMLKNPKYPRPLILLFDEGHGVEAALDSDASVSIDPKTLTAIDYRFERYFPDLNDMDEVILGLKKLKQSLESDMEFEATVSPETRDNKKYKRIESLQTKIETTLGYINNGIEYVSCDRQKVDIRPLKIHALFEKTFTFPTVFLSATLLSKKGFCSMTGIDPEQMGWFSLDSPFPLENRPIYYWWRNGSRPFITANREQELPNVLLRIDEILDRHPSEKGIIHTHTYENANIVFERLGKKHGRRFLFPKSAAEQRWMLEEHARSTNTVLISPSMTEGVDLREDLCRFSILMKVPYLPLFDPVVSARKAADEEWYSYRTAMTVVQAPGRGVRSETDFAVTYLVDPGFVGFINRSRQHFPSWFLDSVVKGYRGSY